MVQRRLGSRPFGLEKLSTGALALWGFLISSPDMGEEEVRGTFDAWVYQLYKTVSHVEKHDLLVKEAIVSRDGGGFSIRVVAADRSFRNWETGEIREFEESYACYACRDTVGRSRKWTWERLSASHSVGGHDPLGLHHLPDDVQIARLEQGAHGFLQGRTADSRQADLLAPAAPMDVAFLPRCLDGQAWVQTRQ